MTPNKMYKNFDELPLVLTVPEAAEVLKIGISLAYGLVSSGQLRHIRLGRKIRIPRTALAEFLEL